jgi:hypothetical protein
VGRASKALTRIVRAQEREIEAWQAAELHLLEQAFRQRLDRLGIPPGPDLAVGLMAVATLLAAHVPEWGGDCRETLGEIALLGLRLLEDAEDAATA